MKNLLIFCLLLPVFLSAEEPSQEQCSEERPVICTMDYRPVCGVDVEGSQKTYGNGCGACSNESVVSFSDGECKEEGK